MRMLAEFLSARSVRVVLATLIVISLACTQIPLFNYLGFEFSALVAVLGSFASGLLTILSWQDKRIQQNSFPQFVLSANTGSLLLMAAPLVVMAANALFVKNCSLVDGLAFFALIVIPSVLFTNSLALMIAVSFKRWRKTLFTVCFLFVLSLVAVETFTKPQIFAFNHILGFFPGLSYDETLQVQSRLLLYRVSTLAYVGLFTLIPFLVLRKKTKGVSTTSFVLDKLTWLGGALLLVLTVFFLLSDQLGLSSSEDSIRKELGGIVETEHFTIVYPKDVARPEQTESIFLLPEFYFDQVRTELRVNPVRKISIYVYGTPDQKGKLFGSARTNVAKPWLRQLHINLEDVQTSLRHELVHVMAADFGFPLLRISLNPGLTEGTAVAVERVNYGETVHRTAAQVFAIGIHPDMESLFSFSGFAKINPGVSYSLAGSFCRFLIDRYGLRRFKRVYQTGNFRGFYNRDLKLLIEEWRKFLNGSRLTEGERMKAEYLFKRPTIFGKECARVIANLNGEARTLFEHRQFEKALTAFEQSLALSRTPEAVAQKTRCLSELKRFREVIEFANHQLKDSLLGPSLLTIRLTLGNAYWALDSVDQAREQYETLLSAHLSSGVDEACALRLDAMLSKTPEELKEYFTLSTPDSTRIEYLQNGRSNVAKYLLARELLSKERYDEGLACFKSIDRMEAEVLEYLRHRRIARVYYALRQYQKAKLYFWESLNFTSNGADLIETKEWLARCDWIGRWWRDVH